MRKNTSSISISILIFTTLILIIGCDYSNKNEYAGKTFKVRTELMKGNGTEVITWENANNLSYDEESYIYQFYVNAKLVSLQPKGTVIIEEQ